MENSYKKSKTGVDNMVKKLQSKQLFIEYQGVTVQIKNHNFYKFFEVYKILV